MTRTQPAAAPRLIPHGTAAPTAEALELWLAVRLHARHRAEPVRTLEALAAALANRLRHAGIRGGPAPAALPGDPAWARAAVPVAAVGGFLFYRDEEQQR